MGKFAYLADIPKMTRPTRQYPLPNSLKELSGPTSGVHRLPIELDWTPTSKYDLADPERLRVMYATVLREARSTRQFCDHINGELLRTVWSKLILPNDVRNQWENKFEELRSA